MAFLTPSDSSEDPSEETKYSNPVAFHLWKKMQDETARKETTWVPLQGTERQNQKWCAQLLQVPCSGKFTSEQAIKRCCYNLVNCMSCSSRPWLLLLSYPTCEIKCVSLDYSHHVSPVVKGWHSLMHYALAGQEHMHHQWLRITVFESQHHAFQKDNIFKSYGIISLCQTHLFCGQLHAVPNVKTSDFLWIRGTHFASIISFIFSLN